MSYEHLEIYGKSTDGNYAIGRDGDRVWRSVEVIGDRYHRCSFDEVPECDWGRIDALKEQMELPRCAHSA